MYLFKRSFKLCPLELFSFFFIPDDNRWQHFPTPQSPIWPPSPFDRSSAKDWAWVNLSAWFLAWEVDLELHQSSRALDLELSVAAVTSFIRPLNGLPCSDLIRRTKCSWKGKQKRKCKVIDFVYFFQSGLQKKEKIKVYNNTLKQTKS